MNKDRIFKALSNPVRRNILYWLKDICVNFPYPDYPPELGVAAGQINRRSGLSQSTISSHLSILLDADLVTANKSGTWIFFKRNDATINAFLREIASQL